MAANCIVSSYRFCFLWKFLGTRSRSRGFVCCITWLRYKQEYRRRVLIWCTLGTYSVQYYFESILRIQLVYDTFTLCCETQNESQNTDRQYNYMTTDCLNSIKHARCPSTLYYISTKFHRVHVSRDIDGVQLYRETENMRVWEFWLRDGW